MRYHFKKQLLFLLLLCANATQAQFTTALGYDLSFLHTERDYIANLYVYNDNETIDVYRVQSELGATAHGFSIRSSGAQFQDPKKIKWGYSLGIGYRGFSSRGKLLYQHSSTTNRDSIVNDLDDYAFRSRYHSIRFDHFIDCHWNPTKTIKITSSIGIGLAAIVKANAGVLPLSGTFVSTNHPILKVQYQPQITERYERFSITCFAAIDLFAMDLFTKVSEYETPDLRVPLSQIRFNTIGIRLIPHPKEKTELKGYPPGA